MEGPLPLASCRRLRRRGVRRGRRAHRSGARRWTPGDQLGARDARHRRPVRTIAHRGHGVAPAVDREGRRAGLRRGGNRLRRARHTRDAPLPRRRERGARCARHRTRRAPGPRSRRQQQDLRVGAVAGRSGGLVRRRDRADVRAGSRSARRRVGRARNRRRGHVPRRRDDPRDPRLRGDGHGGYRRRVPGREGGRRAHTERAATAEGRGPEVLRRRAHRVQATGRPGDRATTRRR